MATTPNLNLPLLAAAQAQKHVTHNEALVALDRIVHLTITDRDLASPPSDAEDGDRYLVANGATGAWSGQDGAIACFEFGAWTFLPPQLGWIAWIGDEGTAVAYDGMAWRSIGSGGGGTGGGVPESPSLLGINTTADTTNRLSLKSDAVLHSHDDITPGTGDTRHVLNKAAADNTASIIFQNDFQGRAEFGLSGDDDWRVKVSADGAVWQDALVVDGATAEISFPNTHVNPRPNLLINSDFRVNQRRFDFGALSDGTYGLDRWRAAGATDLGWNAETQTLTLNTGGITQTVEPGFMFAGSLAGQQVTISVEGLGNSDLAVSIGSTTTTLSPGRPRTSATVTLGSDETGPIAVTLATTDAPAWFQRVKLEIGAKASPWDDRGFALELLACQRYFSKSFPYAERPRDAAGGALLPARAGFSIGTGVIDSEWVPYPVEMRTLPTIKLYNFLGQANKWAHFRAGVGWVNSNATSIVNEGIGGFVARQLTSDVLDRQGFIVRGGFAADAEY